MFHVKYPFYFILLHLIIATPQLNLHYTDRVSESESDSDNALQHNCLRTDVYSEDNYVSWEIVYFCMSELPSTFNVETNSFFPKFTFAELSKQNVTSQQLYLWSASIDIIELYQYYLNQLSTSNHFYWGTRIFYNCTWPRFGPVCQYQLSYEYPDQSSLYEIVHDFYRKYKSEPTSLTCYMHLQCYRGAFPSCLDWTEICDGKLDCLNDGVDEKHCWQLEINKCKDNEYRCLNGQCIPQSFFQDFDCNPNCVDGSDRISLMTGSNQYKCFTDKLSLAYDDMICDYTHLTSSCLTDRSDLLLKAMFSIQDNSVSENCWSALKCIFNVAHSEYPSCDKLCEQDTCIEIIKNDCPDMLYFPNTPVFFDHVYFAFKKSDSQYVTTEDIGLLYICYNNSRYDAFFNISSKVSFKNTMCFIHETVSYPSRWSSLWKIKPDASLRKLYNGLKKYQLVFNYTSEFCNRSNMYQCINSSKCISIHRLMDNMYDCPHMDDENIFEINNTDIIEQFKQSHYKCTGSNKYIHQTLLKNGNCDCRYIESDWCDDENRGSFNFKRNISFQTICDGFVELIPVVINGRIETDETECEKWECNNKYTHCNYVWNCPNGEDEVGCSLSVPFNCSSDHHICVSPYTDKLMCLPISKANDGKIDCLGAYDEPTLCRRNYGILQYENFYCMNQTLQLCIDDTRLCDGKNDCEHGDDEQFCEKNRTFLKYIGICVEGLSLLQSDVEKVLCNQVKYRVKKSTIYFILDRMSNSVEYKTKNIENTMFSSSSVTEMFRQHQPHCHRGLDLRVWLNNKNGSTTYTCLCPPSYYGDICQYQNQRISLSIQFRALSNSWQTPFAIVILLIDDSEQRIIHSYEQITYLWAKNSETKFEIYLLYSTRPKDPTKNYSIHIDFYEKFSLAYRGSVLLPVTFPFLPVHRLAFIVDIPRSYDKTQSCSNDQCVHGKCIKYSNNPESIHFCQCFQGWSGRYCTFSYALMCLYDSLSIGISANNQPVCVCPMNKFGPRCLLTYATCLCLNGGVCILINGYTMSDRKSTCICPQGFSGERCEIVDNKLILSFDKNIVLSQSIFIHFIDLTYSHRMVRSTTFRTIPVKQDSIIIYWRQPFHLVFTELSNKNYYLTILQEIYKQSLTIFKMINPSDRCPHISELFNQTFVQWHLIRRIKYYHLPCQQQSLNLSCFYDDIHLCLCYDFGQKRLANCFNFLHNSTFNCEGQSECENGAQCFQDSPTNPTRSMCICPPCFYGSRCQFSTSGFGLSLDAILGYHILPNVSLTHQPPIIQVSLALTIIFMVAELMNSVFCMITFKNKSVREVGCGVYLLGSSITILFIMIIFGLKFFILVLTQMTIISNRSFLLIQCISFDFILRVCLNMDQWLNACVAIERTIIARKGPGFDKKKSKKMAKFIIVILLVVIAGTCIHDPIHRRLIDEINSADENRIWCIVTYPSSLQILNSITHTVHFFCPFMINLVSAIIFVVTKSRQQSNIYTRRPYKKILRKQIRKHKHLLTAPIVLVILALPRLIMIFLSKCMESTNDTWLFLIGYFISFIPPTLTFVIYILPSKFYKKEFRKSVQRYRINIQQRLHLIS